LFEIRHYVFKFQLTPVYIAKILVDAGASKRIKNTYYRNGSHFQGNYCGGNCSLTPYMLAYACKNYDVKNVVYCPGCEAN
jgi:hypothetical protein